MKKISYFLFALALLIACNSQQKQKEEEAEKPMDDAELDMVKERQGQLKQTVEAYFNTYAERTDFDKFMSFYAENAMLDDVVFGSKSEGKDSIRNYLNWDSGDVVFDTTKSFVDIDKIAIGQNTASVEGHFAPFTYQGKEYDSWRFTTWLTFNKDNKISLHVDYINYPLDILEMKKEMSE